MAHQSKPFSFLTYIIKVTVNEKRIIGFLDQLKKFDKQAVYIPIAQEHAMSKNESSGFVVLISVLSMSPYTIEFFVRMEKEGFVWDVSHIDAEMLFDMTCDLSQQGIG